MPRPNYEKHKADARIRRKADTRRGQDIGTVPAIVDPIRRRDCLADFELFCRTYGAAAFNLAWADSHKRAAAKIQLAADNGGWFANAEPRGGGKTTRARWGGIWSLLRGQCPYVIVLGANEGLSERLLKSIRTELLTNQLLFEDFPHAIYPIRCLQNESRGAAGQRYKGELTAIEWGANRIVLPWIPGDDSLSSGSVIEAFGLTSAVRGPQHTRPDGSIIRPSFVIADDPQTRESAKSPSQTQTRLEILTGDVAYLAGPGQPISIVCPCTVIYQGDLADQLLNRDKHPEWQGERTQMVESFPRNMPLWDEYADRLRASWAEDGNGEAATDFYRENREAMDAGSRVSWNERKKPSELSAIQHAMNLRIRDEAAFFAECQNEPVVSQDDLESLTSDQLAAKISAYPRGVVPPDCVAVTAFTDVQKEHLFWMVVAWKPDFTGYIVDYGAWPDQKRNYYTRRDIRNKLSKLYDGDESGITFAAFNDLSHRIGGPFVKGESRRPFWVDAGGREVSLARWCIDGNWRDRERAVQTFARQSPLAPIITLTYGRGVRATERPFSEAQRAIKWRTGPGWFWIDGPGPAKGVCFDANLWKKRVHNALVLSQESSGSIQLFKANPQIHRMVCDHWTSEKPNKTESNGRVVYEWPLIPGRDNEAWDALVGCAVGASIAGISRVSETVQSVKKKKRRVTSYA